MGSRRWGTAVGGFVFGRVTITDDACEFPKNFWEQHGGEYHMCCVGEFPLSWSMTFSGWTYHFREKMLWKVWPRLVLQGPTVGVKCSCKKYHLVNLLKLVRRDHKSVCFGRDERPPLLVVQGVHILPSFLCYPFVTIVMALKVFVCIPRCISNNNPVSSRV